MEEATTRLSAALADRYRIERELGGGGMSRVFLALEHGLNREVVIKVLSGDLAATVSVERFAREIQLAASLQQANIVPLLSAGEADGLPYFTMPYVQGESLRRRLAQGDRLSIAECVGILRDVARALSYAHARGVVHRDIKPDNVLLSHGAAMVTDFGIAKAISAGRGDRPARAEGARDPYPTDLTLLGSSLGTPAYMSPEQVAADPNIDHRADLYAWGCLAYELLVGAPPFVKESPQRVMAAHLSEAPAPIRPRRAEVPPALERVVLRCLAKEPGARPASADDVLRELDAVVTPSGVALDTATPAPANRRARTIGVAVLGVLIIVASVLAALMRGRSPEAGASTARTIVVMPFDNLGPPSDAYFADGVSEEIGSRLGQIPGIRVVGRASAARFKASNRGAEDIARELGADYVLTGSVRWDRASGAQGSDATVRITPTLTRANTGERLWGEPITEKLTDVFKVQAAVAERVATALSVSLAATTRTSIQRADTQDPEAREATLLGWALVTRRGEANIKQAIVQFERAIARDSMYARAWAGLAEAQAVGHTYNVSGLDTSGRAARRAVALDSLSSEAWTALSSTLQTQNRFREALDAADRAVALDPSSAAAHSRRGMALLARGRVREAEAPLRMSVQLDPLIGAYSMRLFMLDLADGHSDSLSRRVARVRALEPTNSVLTSFSSLGLLQLGRVNEAIEACATTPGAGTACRATFEALANPARRAEAIAMLDGHDKPGALALVQDRAIRAAAYAHLGETDKAFATLREAFETRGNLLFAYINSPWLVALKSDPRWQTIVVAGQNR